MWELIQPMIGPFLLTGFAYFTFDVVGPYAEKVKQFEESCSKRGGMVYEQRGQPTICIKKEILKI
jgi:hypothetical protein